jgi:nucleoside-diphosphate-sugar epimerase
MKQIAITGGSGGLGTWVVRRIAAEHYAVRNLDRVAPPHAGGPTAAPFIAVDLTDYGQTFAALYGCEAVVHLAAQPIPDADFLTGAERFRNNTLGAFNVFQAAAALGLKRVVWASSDTVLGYPYRAVQPVYLPVDEAHPVQPQCAYALSKVICEELARQMCRMYGLTILALRFSHVFYPGPNSRDPYPEPQALAADPLQRKFNLWGYVDARDAAQAVQCALEADVTGADEFLITAADTIMDRPNAQLVAAAFPDVPLRPDTGPYETLESIAKARRVLGYDPQYSWRDS